MPALPILNQQKGPFPITVPINAPTDGPSCLMIAGSVWTQQTNALIGIQVSLDGTPIGVAQVFSNIPAVHRAAVPTYIPLQLTFGPHTLTLTASTAATVSDYNDFFDAVLFY
jgi:hypothetical protein